MDAVTLSSTASIKLTALPTHIYKLKSIRLTGFLRPARPFRVQSHENLSRFFTVSNLRQSLA